MEKREGCTGSLPLLSLWERRCSLKAGASPGHCIFLDQPLGIQLPREVTVSQSAKGAALESPGRQPWGCVAPKFRRPNGPSLAFVGLRPVGPGAGLWPRFPGLRPGLSGPSPSGRRSQTGVLMSHQLPGAGLVVALGLPPPEPSAISYQPSAVSQKTPLNRSLTTDN